MPLPVEVAHGLAVRHLPDHHRDPFDRLLVAQAQAEGLTVVTADQWIPRYDVAVLPADVRLPDLPRDDRPAGEGDRGPVGRGGAGRT